MIKALRRKTNISYLLALMALIVSVVLPAGSWVLAQEGMKYFSSVHYIYTADFEIENPEAMVYAPDADSFIIWGANNRANVIKSGQEMRESLTPAQQIENPLGLAIDQHSRNLFILGANNTELFGIGVEPNGLPSSSKNAARFDMGSFKLQNVRGMTFDPATGRLFILDAGVPNILVVSPHPTQGLVGDRAVKRVALASLSRSALQGVAFNPENNHLYVGSPDEQRIYELMETGEKLSTYDVSDLPFENVSTMLFAPTQDTTDDPTSLALYILDRGQPLRSVSSDQRSNSQRGQIVELSLQAPATLPPGTTLLPGTLVHTIDTSKPAWNPSAPDPAGIDYLPLTNRLFITDSEVEEMPNYYQGKNAYQSTMSGTLTNTCDTTSYTDEPTGVAINPNNNHIFISDDTGSSDRVFEVSLGPDGTYCTGDDSVTSTNVNSLYNISDAEDVAYGENAVFVAGGISAEVYKIPLGANGVLGGGDDGPMTHFDTASLGFTDLEGIGYNLVNGTLFMISTVGSERYLGETSKTGTLLRAYDLSFMGTAGNLRSDVTYAPSSQNPAFKNIYIVSRAVDNDIDPKENDGKVWEVQISAPITPTSTPTLGTGFARVKVLIGGKLKNEYNIPPQKSLQPGYAGVNDGPVKIQSTNGVPVVASERVAFSPNGSIWTSYGEMMGMPSNQLANSYIFPLYNNVGFNSQLRIANVGTSTTKVTVKVHNILKGSYDLAPNAVKLVRYTGLNDGPVLVQSLASPIVASIRMAYTPDSGQNYISASELMGLPAKKLTSIYYFPWYDNVSTNSQLRIANVGTGTTKVTIKVHNVVKSSFNLAPNAVKLVRYTGLNDGPVKVQSSGNVKIIVSLRTAYSPDGGATWTDASEMMGQPNTSLSARYAFPTYNNVDHNSQLRIANLGNAATSVTITIKGLVQHSIQIAANTTKRVSYPVNGGTLLVQGSGNVPILVSKRVGYFNSTAWISYSEMMGLPQSQWAKIYYFPYYNNVNFDTLLMFGVP
jgi:hypothetical protein